MPHLGVAHLVVRQANCGAAGFYQCVGIGVPEGIHHRCAGSTNGVAFRVLAVAPTIKNGEYNRGYAS